MRLPRISVVIATYKREKVLCDVLQQVVEEDYPDFEVVVVDQTPIHEPETIKRLEGLKGRIRYIWLAEANLTKSENVGIREANGDIVLFLDDDVRIEPGLLRAHAANYMDGEWAGVAGMVTHDGMPPTRNLPEICGYSRAGWFFFEHNYNRRVEVKVGPGGNMSLKRDLLMKAGGLDEGLKESAIHWEIDLVNRVREVGGRIVHDPKARVHHLRAMSGGVRMGRIRQRSYFESYVRVLWRHVPRHERAVVIWRLLRDQVLRRSGLHPGALATNMWRMARELAKVVKNGPAKAILPLKNGAGR